VCILINNVGGYKSPQILHDFYLTNLGRPGGTFDAGTFYRIELNDVKTRASKDAMVPIQRPLGDHCPCELPTINPNFSLKKHRYVYSPAINDYKGFESEGICKTRIFNSLAKFDIETKEVIYFRPGINSVVGEGIFFPAPEGKLEDDGVVLTLVLFDDSPRSVLYILNARDMSTIATIEPDVVIPLGFHGLFKSN
jgi:carotenoid cleavage dioxygenase-like enzyme